LPTLLSDYPQLEWGLICRRPLPGGSSMNISLQTKLIGALLGFVPTFITVTYQAKQQRNQFLLDRKLTALREFTAAVNGDGELFVKFDELEIAVYDLMNEPDSRAKMRQVTTAWAEVMRLKTPHAAKMQTEVIVLDSLFGAKFPVPDYLPVPNLASDTPTMSKTERIALCQKLLKQTADSKNSLIQSTTEYQGLLSKIAIGLK
jgi:hypothetical protein